MFNKYFKRFFSFLLCFCIISFSCRSKKVYANPAVIPVVEVSGEAFVTLCCASLVAYDIYDWNVNGGKERAESINLQLKQSFKERWEQCQNKMDMVKVRVADDGKKFLNWSEDGLKWYSDMVRSLLNDDSLVYSYSGSSATVSVPIVSGETRHKIKVSEKSVFDVEVTCNGVTNTGVIQSGESRTYDDVIQCNTCLGWAVPVQCYSWRGNVQLQFSDIGKATSAHYVIKARGSAVINSEGKIKDNYKDNEVSQSVCAPTSVSVPVRGIDEVDSSTGATTRTYEGIGDDVVGSGAFARPWSSVDSTYKTDTKDMAIDTPWSNSTDIPIDTPVDKPVDGAIDGSGSLIDGVLNIPILGDILKALLGIWDFLKSILNSILNAINSILDFLKGLVQALLDGIVSLFVPSASDITSKYDDFRKNVSKTFKVPDTHMINGNSITPITIFKFSVLGYPVVLDFSFLLSAPVVNFCHVICAGLSLFLLSVFVYRKIVFFLNDNEPVMNGQTPGSHSPSGKHL